MTSPNDNDDYLSFYQREYGEFLVERRLVDGKDAIGMFIAQQTPGHYPDEALSTYNLQLNMGGDIYSAVDLGAGRHKVTLGRGGFVVAPADTPADYELYNDHRILCLGLPKSFVENAAEDLGIDTNSFEALLTDGHKDPIIRQAIKECWSEANNQGERGPLFVDANLMIIASRLLSLAVGKDRSVDEDDTKKLPDVLYDRVREYVDSNIDTSLRMKTLAGLSDLTDHAFSRAFKARTGMSPYQWVIERRLARAEQLLRGSKMSLAEIAFAVGFSSQSHMTTLFSQRTGVTPAEFRKKL